MSLPAVIQIDDSEDVAAYAHPVPDATTVRLAPTLHGLTDDVVRDLLEMLVGIQGIHPSEVPTPAPREESVPLLAPSTITDDQIAWTITDQLSLVHADRQDVYFALTEASTDTATRPHVELTPAQTWLLVRALTTVRCWQFELEAAFAAAATQLRTSLLPTDATPAVTGT